MFLIVQSTIRNINQIGYTFTRICSYKCKVQRTLFVKKTDKTSSGRVWIIYKLLANGV